MNHFNTVEDFILDPSFRKWVLHQDPKAKAQWKAFLDAHPERYALVEKAKSLLEELPRTSYQMSEMEINNLWQQIDSKADQQAIVSSFKRHKKREILWYAAAASIAVILFFAIGFWKYSQENTFVTYRTEYAETDEILLPDGSLVTLNANSSLSFDSANFNVQSREVWMQGEAFFEITKLRNRDGKAEKFIVHTEDLEVEVLGTQFNVNTRRSGTKVLLTEGSVRLNLNNNLGDHPIMMLPGEMAIYTPKRKAVVKENVNTDIYTAWKQQKLVFDDTPIGEIIEILEDNYGIKVKLENPEIANRRYRGTFKQPDPNTILTVISSVLKLEMERHENVVTLK